MTQDDAGAARTWVLVLLGVVLVAAAAIALALTRSPSKGDERTATVDTVRPSPRITVFAGKSCSGPRGTWYLNAVQGGASELVRAEYYLRWSFPSGSSEARPTGRVHVSAPPGMDVSATLDKGTLMLSGTAPGGKPVRATGHVLVRLTGTAAAPTLTVAETGVADAQRTLGMASPFGADGEPLAVPVRLSRDRKGC